MAVGTEAMSAGAEPTAGGIKGAKLIRIENSAHALFYEEREKFNAELNPRKEILKRRKVFWRGNEMDG